MTVALGSEDNRVGRVVKWVELYFCSFLPFASLREQASPHVIKRDGARCLRRGGLEWEFRARAQWEGCPRGAPASVQSDAKQVQSVSLSEQDGQGVQAGERPSMRCLDPEGGCPSLSWAPAIGCWKQVRKSMKGENPVSGPKQGESWHPCGGRLGVGCQSPNRVRTSSILGVGCWRPCRVRKRSTR